MEAKHRGNETREKNGRRRPDKNRKDISPRRTERMENTENWRRDNRKRETKIREKPKNFYNHGQDEPELVQQHRETNRLKSEPNSRHGPKYKGPRYNRGNADNEREHFQKIIGSMTEKQ